MSTLLNTLYRRTLGLCMHTLSQIDNMADLINRLDAAFAEIDMALPVTVEPINSDSDKCGLFVRYPRAHLDTLEALKARGFRVSYTYPAIHKRPGLSLQCERAQISQEGSL